jgi:hypothetical protein
MGAMAEAFVAFAQPLIDQTDGSQEQLQKAFDISQLCYNLALVPEDRRDTVLAQMRQSLGMADEEFDDFQRSIILPMIERHHEMFPFLHQRDSRPLSQSGPALPAQPAKAARGERYPGTDRYAPCPCGSGQKYKFCCGKRGS